MQLGIDRVRQITQKWGIHPISIRKHQMLLSASKKLKTEEFSKRIQVAYLG
jgi:hypothetical protein